MKNKQTYSWIFLSIALGTSDDQPIDLKGISDIADGINHSIPTSQEIKKSLSWLTSENIITKVKTKYILTEKGKQIYEQISKQHNHLLAIWEELERII